MGALLARLPFWPKGRIRLLEGQVYNEADITPDQNGAFNRLESTFRRQDLDPDAIIPGRWHLFACYGCPWAHRAILTRHLKGLEEAVPLIATEGWWPFTRGMPAITTGGWRVDRPMPDSTFSSSSPAALRASAAQFPFYLWKLYTASDPKFTGRITVPVLWDAKESKIVNNESADIVRILNSPAFSKLGSAAAPDLYPEALRSEIDEVNGRLYEGFNNGVYRCGFGAASAFETARAQVRETMGYLEERLATRRYLCGERLTESDVRCFTTLVRFDSAYYNAFRCNLGGTVRRRYPNLQRYLRDLYTIDAFRKSCQGMLFGYPLMYFCICRWQGRRISNALRLGECALFAVMRALAPDTPGWRFWLASLLALPLRLLGRLADPWPNPSLL